MKRRLALLSMFGWVLVLGPIRVDLRAQGSTSAPTVDSAGEPVTIPRARQYDITSRINGQAYRIFVATAPNAQPTAAQPVVYVLDGNMFFGDAAGAVALQSALGGLVAPATIVGIGYPTGTDIMRRRVMDLTPSAVGGPGQTGGGGGDTFLRVIEEEVKPFVMARYRVDSSKQSIYGYSLGGLAVLRSLFRTPTAFSTYIAASPSIWWNNREILADEEAFAKRARAGELHLKLLITSAGDEQYRGEDPKRLESERIVGRMVDNATELAARLAALNPNNVTVIRTVFEGELHITGTQAALSRGVRFAASPTEITLGPKVLARYVGEYQMSPTGTISVVETAVGLRVQLTPGPPFQLPLVPVSETEFVLKDWGGQLTFERDSTGGVTGLVLYQPPARRTPAKKIK